MSLVSLRVCRRLGQFLVPSINQWKRPWRYFRPAHPSVELITELDENVPEFKFDPDQMNRVLVNLIDNSISAVSSDEVKQVRVATKYDGDLGILDSRVRYGLWNSICSEGTSFRTLLQHEGRGHWTGIGYREAHHRRPQRFYPSFGEHSSRHKDGHRTPCQ